VRQEPLHQQAAQTCKDSSKLDLAREEDGVLGNREELGAAEILGTNSYEMPQRHWGIFL